MKKLLFYVTTNMTKLKKSKRLIRNCIKCSRILPSSHSVRHEQIDQSHFQIYFIFLQDSKKPMPGKKIILKPKTKPKNNMLDLHLDALREKSALSSRSFLARYVGSQIIKHTIYTY